MKKLVVLLVRQMHLACAHRGLVYTLMVAVELHCKTMTVPF